MNYLILLFRRFTSGGGLFKCGRAINGNWNDQVVVNGMPGLNTDASLSLEVMVHQSGGYAEAFLNGDFVANYTYVLSYKAQGGVALVNGYASMINASNYQIVGHSGIQ